MAKKFSCGASVVKNPNGTEEIDVQGDFTDELIEFMAEKFKVSELSQIFKLFR
jgi:translation initiation factor 1 (eIF-1/SUI1)